MIHGGVFLSRKTYSRLTQKMYETYMKNCFIRGMNI